MVAPSSARRTASARRTTASRTTAERVSPIPAATRPSSSPISSSLNLVGTGVVIQISIQSVEQIPGRPAYVSQRQAEGDREREPEIVPKRSGCLVSENVSKHACPNAGRWGPYRRLEVTPCSADGKQG